MTQVITYSKGRLKGLSSPSSHDLALMSSQLSEEAWDDICKDEVISSRAERSAEIDKIDLSKDVKETKDDVKQKNSLISYFPKRHSIEGNIKMFSMKSSLDRDFQSLGKNKKIKERDNKSTIQYEQLYLDVGQKSFRFETCSVCSMTYHNGVPEDKLLHQSYHKRYIRGIEMKVIFDEYLKREKN
jgi:hypothetical protein